MVLCLAAAPLWADGPAVLDQRSVDLARAGTESVIADAAGGADPFIRANAVEASQHIPSLAARLVPAALQDQAAVVRFTALVVMGRLNLSSNSAVARQLLDDSNASVRAAALFALTACGEKVDITPLAGLLHDDHPGTRANAAMLLGLIGDSSAVALLKDAARDPMSRVSAQQAAIVRLQIAEAVVNLGDEESIDAIRSALFSQFAEVQVVAATMLGKLKDRQMQPALEGMLADQPIEIQLAAAGALAQMGKPRGVEAVLAAANHDLDTVRGQAALVLGRFPGRDAEAALARLMQDASPAVRVAAAAALADRPRR